MFLVPLGSKVFYGVLGLAYVRCLFVCLVSLLLELLKLIRTFLLFLIIRTTILWICLRVHPIPFVCWGYPPSLSCFQASLSSSLFILLPVHWVYLGHTLSSSVIRVFRLLYFVFNIPFHWAIKLSGFILVPHLSLIFLGHPSSWRFLIHSLS